MPTDTELGAGLGDLCRALGTAAPSEHVCAELVAYAQLVATWNQRVDLTAAKKPRELVEVLFADALVLSDLELVTHGARLLDVGTGVGAPIIPLVLLRPDLHAQCIEPRRKRVAFLRTVMGQLELMQRLSVVEGRVELEHPKAPTPAVDLACSRATFAPPHWLELGLQLAPRVLVLAARNGLPTTPAQARLVTQREYALPSSGARRVLGLYARA